MNKPIYFLLLFLIFSKFSSSQSLADIKIDSWLCCNLHTALSDVAKNHDVKFNYEVERFENIKYNEHPINRSLDLFLEKICKANKLKYYIDDDGIIHIVDKWVPVGQEMLEVAQKKYTGSPDKRNFTLTGRIVDKNTRESLPFVSVVVKGTRIGTTSNVDGFFTLMKVPSDTSTILFSYLGYQKRNIQLTPSISGNNLVIELEGEALSLEEVTITAEKQDILQISGNQLSKIKMSPLKLNTLPNLGEKDILRSFQLMPGISAANENSSGLYVRGGTPDQVLVLYDGFTVYNVEHMFGFFSAFNSNAIKDVQLYKGGFDSKYGGRLASVVEITGKEGNQKEFNGAIDVSLMSLNSFIEFPIGEKITAVIAARRSWKTPVYNKIFDQFTDENESPMMGGMGRGGFGGSMAQDTKSYFYDLNGKIVFRPNHKDNIALSFYNGKDNLDNSIIPQMPTGFGGGNFDFNMETIDLTNWGNTGISLKWSRQFSSRIYMNTLISYSNYFSLRDRSTSGSFSRGDGQSNSISRGLNEDNNLKDITGKIDVEYKLSEKNQLEFGLQASRNDIEYTYNQNDTISVIDRSTMGTIYSAYLQDEISLFNSKLMLTPGLRYNYFTETKENYIEPRLNFMYKVSDKVRFKGAFGNYYQFAKRVIREDITEGSRDFWVLSDNDKLPVSSSMQYILGFSYETPKYLFDVEGFYKLLDNITEYSLRIEANRRSVDYSENFFTGTGISKGIDFLAQKKYGKVTGWIGYTIAQVANNIPEFGEYDYYASHDVTHEFKSVATYKWQNWDFGANWIFATGRPYTSPEGGYQLTLLDGTTTDYINISVKNGNRFKDYHRLDLSATYNFIFGNNSPANIGLSLFNVYNRANIWYKEYEIIENDVVETPVYYLGLTPNISFTIKFK